MNPPNKKYPKTFPFVFDNDSNLKPTEPPPQPNHHPNHHPQNNGYPSDRGLLNVAISLISSLSMGIGLAAGGWVGFRILQYGLSEFPLDELIAGIIAAGLAYAVGWVVGLFGIRMLANFILPYAMAAYAWITLAGLSVLQIAIISKLFNQEHSAGRFVFYVILFGAGIIALIGIHLLIEDHDLVPFALPILIVSLIHLYLIVYHYVFSDPNQVQQWRLVYDAIFFIITATVSILMLAHLGILSGLRNGIDKAFNENTRPLVPPR